MEAGGTAEEVRRWEASATRFASNLNLFGNILPLNSVY
jgi:hypothetical protein